MPGLKLETKIQIVVTEAAVLTLGEILWFWWAHLAETRVRIQIPLFTSSAQQAELVTELPRLS